MNDFDQSFLAFQAAEHSRRIAEAWLSAFETALVSRDAARIGALFHQDCHWHDILAFTWHMTPVAGRDNVAERLAADQRRTAAHGFHLPPGRKPPREVKRLGIDSIEAIFEFATTDGRGAGIIRLSPGPTVVTRCGRGCCRRRLSRWTATRRKSAPTVPPAPPIRAISAATTGLTCAARPVPMTIGSQRYW